MERDCPYGDVFGARVERDCPYGDVFGARAERDCPYGDVFLGHERSEIAHMVTFFWGTSGARLPIW